MQVKQLFFIILVILSAHNVWSQDPHFSQFFSSPLTLNPANTGKFDGVYRVAGNYRNQWPDINNAFNTQTISVDCKLLQKYLADNDNFGFGAMFLNDNSANGAVNFNYASFSLAYHKGLDEEGLHQLGIGLQGTFANMLIKTSQLAFEDQLTNAGFTGVTNEVFRNAQLTSSYFDMSCGLMYTGSNGQKTNYYAGASLYHFTKPIQDFTGATYYLRQRVTLTAGVAFPASPNVLLHFSGLQSLQGGASETVLGGCTQLIATPDDEKPTSVYIGTWYRLNDAFIPYFGLEYSDFRLGLSYDVNNSDLKTASQARGGFELSLIYAFRPNTDKPIQCPKF